MSRRKESERLLVDLAAAVGRDSVARRPLTKAEARQIKADADRARSERRASSAVTLLRAQWMPWALSLIVFVLGAVTWLMRWLSDDPLLPIMFAAMVVALIAWTGWMAGRRTKKWRGSVHRAAGAASVWLLFAASTGPSFRAPTVLMIAVILASLYWWKVNRPKHPLAPSRAAVLVPKDESIPVLWQENIAEKDRILPGSLLSAVPTAKQKKDCESYTINLVAGKQSITGTIAQLALIAGGLHTPIKQVILEPDEDEDPNHVTLTIVKHSPIEKTMPYKGARIVGDQRNLLEVGPYGDGDGWVQWRMWQPGEQPMTGSWLSGLVIAGTGIGKSRLMELLALGYMASRSAVVWFVDPQGGASSPALQEYADWYVSTDGTDRMIAALERIVVARAKENSARKYIRFDPTPERPGLVVFMDEFHRTVAKYASRLETLAREAQKVGVSIVGLTQDASLESLGKNTLRASMLANLIVMKTGMNTTKTLIPGMTVDPELLPKIPGYLYNIGTDGARTAPGRAEHVANPEQWFEQYAKLMPKLDALSANAAGDVYRMRREDAAEEQEENLRWVEQMSSEGFQPEADEPDLDDWGPDEPAEPRAFQVVQFPSAPGADRLQDKPGRDRVLVVVARGITRTKEIGTAVGLQPSQLHAVLKELLESGELERPTAGVYAIAGSASPPER